MTTLERSRSCTSSTSLSMSSPRPSVQRVTSPGFEPSLTHLYDRVNKLDSQVLELRSTVLTKDEYVDRRNREDEHIRREFEIQLAISHRIDLNVVALREAFESRMAKFDTRMEAFESRMAKFDNLEQYKKPAAFNSKIHSPHSTLNVVPAIREDHSIEWPQYFPKTVWRFWCLKKRSRVHRLVELVEFYKLGDDHDFQAWSRMHSNSYPDGSESESEDEPLHMTRAEAVRRFPEAAHRALANCLGLKWDKIRGEVGEDPLSVALRPPKRQQEDVASASTKSRSKPVKMARRLTVSDVQRLVYGPGSISEAKSSKSEEHDQLGWCAFPESSEDTLSKLPSNASIKTILDGINKGRLKLKPSASEKARWYPTGSKASQATGHAAAASRSEQGEIPNERNTIPTEPNTSVAGEAGPAFEPDVPETASDADTPASRSSSSSQLSLR